MSRIGKKPVDIPNGVKIEINNNIVSVSGPLGKLEKTFHKDIALKITDNKVEVARPSDSKMHKSLHGLTRTLIFNMIEGVTKGFQKQLQVEGVGYRANAEAGKLTLNIGFTKPVEIILPKDIQAKVEKQTIITFSGVNKEFLGEFVASIRSIKKPEPYKGRGIKYVGEYIKRKVGKAATTGAKGK
jgi:large subunit ribosomal protein L6